MLNISLQRPTISQATTFVFLATIGFGFNPLFARFLYADGLTAEWAAMYRGLTPALIFAPTLLALRKSPKLALFGFALGLLVGIGNLAYFRALAHLPIATASLVYFTHPFFTIFLGWLIFKTPITRQNILVATLILIACALILRPTGLTPAQYQALLLTFLMPFTFALIMLCTEHWLSVFPPMTRLSLVNWGQALVIIPFTLSAPAANSLPISPAGWLGLLGLMFISTLIPQFLLNTAIPIVGATRASVFSVAELLTALTIGWFIFTEPMQLTELIGAALIITAVILTSQTQSKSRLTNK